MNRYIVEIEDGEDTWEEEVGATDMAAAWSGTQMLLPHSVSSIDARVVGVREV